MARTTLLTPERHKLLVNAMLGSSTHRNACDAAGVHVDTVYEWIARGKREADDLDTIERELAALKGKRTKGAAAQRRQLKARHAELTASPYPEFSDAFVRASGRALVDAAAAITEAAKDDWRAASWLLERRDPEGYCRHDKLDVGGQAGNPVEARTSHEVVPSGDEEVDRAAEDFLRAVGAKEQVSRRVGRASPESPPSD